VSRFVARIGLAAGLVLITVGVGLALRGVPHLRDPLVGRRLKWGDYEQPQQPGIYAIATGGILVVTGIVTVRWYIRKRD
jgi:hypothetical protein